MTSKTAYHNGEFKPFESISLSVLDVGFIWGATITERVRTFRGELFRLQEHIERFRESCLLAHVPLPETDEELRAISTRLAAENRVAIDLSLVWLATPGVSTRFTYPGLPEQRMPTRIAYAHPIISMFYVQYEGASLITIPATLGVDPAIKHRSRLAWWIARQEVLEKNRFAEPLFVDPSTGDLLETASANILLVIEGKLVSPAADTVLKGVSLQVVEELAAKLGIAFERRTVHLSEIYNATEAILTNTTFCLGVVKKIDDHEYSFQRPILTSLQHAWRDMVGCDYIE